MASSPMIVKREIRACGNIRQRRGDGSEGGDLCCAQESGCEARIGAPEPVEPPARQEQGASQRGDRESAPDDSKIAEERSSKYDDSNRRYYAPDQAIEPMQGKGLTVHDIIPVSSPSANAEDS